MATAGRPSLEQLTRLIVRARRLVYGAVAKGLSARGESVLDWQLVSHLVRSGACSQRALAEGVAQHPAGVSRQLEHLEARGLTRRRRDPEDRRCSLVEVTPEGLRWFRAHHAFVYDGVGPALSVLTPAEQAQLARLLTKLLGDAGPGTRRKGAARRRSP